MLIIPYFPPKSNIYLKITTKSKEKANKMFLSIEKQYLKENAFY